MEAGSTEEASRVEGAIPMSTFVHIPADRFLAKLDEISAKIIYRGGRLEKIEKEGSEIVYEIALPKTHLPDQECEDPYRSEFIALKIYTTIPYGSSEVRDSGEDAIRIIVGSISTGEFKRVRDTIIVKRTAPKDVPDRVGAFLERFTLTLRDAYRFAQAVPLCLCGHHMARRESRKGDGQVSAFWGCTTYPACKNTKSI
jgi:hypothetical protein